MKRYIVIIIAILTILPSCKEDDNEEIFISISLGYKYMNHANQIDTLPSGHSIPVFLYKDISPNSATYSYEGAGILLNEDTGQEVAFDRVDTIRSILYLDNLDKTTYSVLIDLTQSKIKDYWFAAFDLNPKIILEGYDHRKKNVVIDIWPYEPWDLFE